MIIDYTTEYAKSVINGKEIVGPHVLAACKRHLKDLEEAPKRGFHFDLQETDRVFRFFNTILKLSDGQFEDKPFELHPSQKFIVGSIFGWKRKDGTRRFCRVYIEQGKGNGKALAIDTPIPTPEGWKQMSDLSVGDRIFDEHGLICNVTAATSIMLNHECYEVCFSDGAKIIADAEHLWRTTTNKGKTAIRTTAEIATTIAKRHRVSVTGALKLPEVQLPIPPYTFGIWLGDGNSDDARITVAHSDWSIVESIEAEGVPIKKGGNHSETTERICLTSGSRNQSDRDNSIQSKLRTLGVLGNKHIPTNYLRASKSQRTELLSGLLDSDGTISEDGQIEFCVTSLQLANNAFELIGSLGFKPTMTISPAFLYGRQVGTRYRIQFWAYDDTSIFKLRRKSIRQKRRPKSKSISQGRTIVKCTLIPSVPVKCISVDSTSRMYLASRHFIPTHNSPLAGGVGLYGLAADNEPGAQIYSAAANKDQARILFNDAVKMAKKSASLAKKIIFSGTDPHTWNMAILSAPQNGSFFRAVSRETKRSGSGPRPHFALIDELHEHPDRGTLEMLERGFKFRRQPLLFMITNSGTDRNSVCFEEHQHAIKVAHGDIEDDSTFSYVCALDENDDPFKDRKCWKKANPLLGTILTEEYLESAVNQAKAIPAKQNAILRLHFCVWTDAETAWIRRDVWESCEDQTLNIDDFEGHLCWAGLDLSATKDLTAKALVFEDGFTDDGKPKFAAFVTGYTPEDTLTQRAEYDKAPYDVWVRDGFLIATPGSVIRYDYVAADLIEDQQRFDLQAVAYDRFLIKHFETAVDELGAVLPLIEHGQGLNQRKGCPSDCNKAHEHITAPLWMPGSINTLEQFILEKRIRVHINPALRSSVASARFWDSPAGLRRFEKQKPGGRIDLLIALTMAIGAADSGSSQIGDYVSGRLLMVA